MDAERLRRRELPLAVGPRGHVAELGLDRPGTKRQHIDARAAQLDPQRLGEAVHVGLGRGVDGEARQRQQPRRRADVADPAALPRQHARHRPVRQPCQRGHVHLEHGVDLVRLAGFERAEVAEAGVVDQDVAGKSLKGIERADQLGHISGIGQVGGDRVHAQRRVRGDEDGAQVLQPLRPPRGQHDAANAEIGQLHRELLPQTGRGTRDDRCLVPENAHACNLSV